MSKAASSPGRSGSTQAYRPTKSVDKALFEILCCPVSRLPLREAAQAELTVANAKASAPLTEGLASTDGARVYPVRNGIPLLLAEEGISLA
ncbi:hypothetical protein BH09VER1_BH09VER1_04630 [soil metagenome]